MQIKQLSVIHAISYLFKNNTNYLEKSHSTRALHRRRETWTLVLSVKPTFQLCDLGSFQSLSYLF